MKKLKVQEFAIKLSMVTFSGVFLAWYLLAKIMVWPWGAYSL